MSTSSALRWVVASKSFFRVDLDWNIARGYRFFLVDRFRETRFIPAGEIAFPSYVELADWIPKVPRKTEGLALELAGRRWR